MAFKKCFYGFLNTAIEILSFKIIFKICCKFFSIYLIINELGINKIFEYETRNKIIAAKILRRLFKLHKLENSNSKNIEKAEKILIL